MQSDVQLADMLEHLRGDGSKVRALVDRVHAMLTSLFHKSQNSRWSSCRVCLISSLQTVTRVFRDTSRMGFL
jgi:hypothetical protein